MRKQMFIYARIEAGAFWGDKRYLNIRDCFGRFVFLQCPIVQSSRMIFFYHDALTTLPDEIQILFAKNKDIVVYINSDVQLGISYEKHNVTREELLNSSGHFNPEGNRIYAEVIKEILKDRIWGKGERSFLFDPVYEKFVNLRR